MKKEDTIRSDLNIPTVEKLSRAGTEFLGVRYPLISGGMTWISNSALVEAVHGRGGFGVLAAGNMPPGLLEEEIERCNAMAGPYAVNLITIAPHYDAHRKLVIAKGVPYVIFAGNFPKRRAVEEVKGAGCKTLSLRRPDRPHSTHGRDLSRAAHRGRSRTHARPRPSALTPRKIPGRRAVS